MRELSEIEKKQIEYLEKQRESLIYQMMGACENIGEQIKAVRNGEWIKKVEE